MVNITCVWAGLCWVAFNVNDRNEVTTARGITGQRATMNLIHKLNKKTVVEILRDSRS